MKTRIKIIDTVESIITKKTESKINEELAKLDNYYIIDVRIDNDNGYALILYAERGTNAKR